MPPPPPVDEGERSKNSHALTPTKAPEEKRSKDGTNEEHSEVNDDNELSTTTEVSGIIGIICKPSQNPWVLEPLSDNPWVPQIPF